MNRTHVGCNNVTTQKYQFWVNHIGKLGKKYSTVCNNDTSVVPNLAARKQKCHYCKPPCWILLNLEQCHLCVQWRRVLSAWMKVRHFSLFYYNTLTHLELWRSTWIGYVKICTSVFAHNDRSVLWQSTWIKVSNFAYFCFCTTSFLELWRSTWFNASSIVYLWCRTLTYFEMWHSTWTIMAKLCYYHLQTTINIELWQYTWPYVANVFYLHCFNIIHFQFRRSLLTNYLNCNCFAISNLEFWQFSWTRWTKMV